MSDYISIGCQSGGPRDGNIGTLKVGLYHAFQKYVHSTYCEAVDEYALVLRVAGALQQFGEEAITRLRFAKKKRYITVDIQIPESVWVPKSEEELKSYLVAKVGDAIRVCINRLKRDGFSVAETSLFAEVKEACDAFLMAGSR